MISKQTKKRRNLRAHLWPDEPAWSAPSAGWFQARRSTPYLLSLLRQKNVSGSKDPSAVYLELLARQWDSGIVELSSEADHAFAAGYGGPRAVRTWQERMHLLEKVGLIKTKAGGAQKFKYVLFVNPDLVAQTLIKNGLASPAWRDAYFARNLDTGEAGEAETAPAETPISKASKLFKKKVASSKSPVKIADLKKPKRR